MRTIDGIEEEPRSFVGNSAAAFGWIVLIVSSLIMLSSCGPKVQPVATVSVNTQQLGAEIPRDFLGFSNEVSTAGMGLPAPSEQARGNIRPPSDVPSDAQLAYVLGEPGAPNIGFFTMMKNLGGACCALAATARTTPAGTRSPRRTRNGVRARSRPDCSSSIRRPLRPRAGA